MLASRLALALGLALSTLSLQPARAWYLSDLPHGKDFCDTGWVLSYIKTRVDAKYRRFNGTQLMLIDILNPRLKHEQVRDEDHNVGRQFCQAKARMSDGSRRNIWYLLETPMGFAGTMGGVDFCIEGLDPWHIYGKDCSTMRQSIGWQTVP